MPSNENSGDFVSVRNTWASHLATQAIRNRINKEQYHSSFGPDVWPAPVSDDQPLPPLPELPSGSFTETPKRQSVPKVAIVGAGAAGLFTAMILDYLNSQPDLGFHVDYDILEAADPTRVGGRLFSYHFPSDKTSSDPTPVDVRFYDVGAMRFPESPIMQRQV